VTESSGGGSARYPEWRGNTGLSLIEVMFATAILAVALVGVMGSLVQSHEANVALRQQTVALEAARTALNEIREMRSSGVEVPDAIIKSVPETAIDVKIPQLENATRQYTFTKLSPGLLQVEAIIAWRDMRGRPARASLATALGNHE